MFWKLQRALKTSENRTCSFPINSWGYWTKTRLVSWWFFQSFVLFTMWRLSDVRACPKAQRYCRDFLQGNAILKIDAGTRWPMTSRGTRGNLILRQTKIEDAFHHHCWYVFEIIVVFVCNDCGLEDRNDSDLARIHRFGWPRVCGCSMKFG